MQNGTVKWFNAQKGFGFIEVESGGPDVFVHISAVERAGFNDLAEGQKLSFEVVADGRSGKSSADQLKITAWVANKPKKEKIMGAILELTTYAATPLGMIAVILLGAAAYFAARWVLTD
jgi:CspA family cold shock protein